MADLKYTLLTDGSSDKTLLHIIQWLLNNMFPKLSCEGNYADFRYLKKPPQTSEVVKRIKYAESLYPFDILIYHRDAEIFDKHIIEKRKEEVFGKIDKSLFSKIVCVVPVTMMETWLLIDREAIRKAAGNRAGSVDLPLLSKLEAVKDPKTRLHQILETTSGLKGRRLKTFNLHSAVHLVAENIKDYSPLRELTAFRKFENDLKAAVDLFLTTDD